jgi:hypothetical protein
LSYFVHHTRANTILCPQVFVRPRKPPTKARKTRDPKPSLTQKQKRIRTAINYASKKFRDCVKFTQNVPLPSRGTGKRYRPRKLAFQPPNWRELLREIPKPQAKPFEIGQRVFYVPPSITPVPWSVATVEHIGPHRNTNWIVVQKDNMTRKNGNPYIAIDSTNVFLAPGTSTRPLPNKGVYVVRSDNAIYVGNSNDIKKRLDFHRQGLGSRSTPPKFEREPTITSKKRGETLPQWEKRELVAQCKVHGINSVRGGGFCERKLRKTKTETLTKLSQ